MASNIIVYTDAPGPCAYAAKVAAAAGDDLGLVLTAIEFAQEKISGGRVEEDRSYSGTTFQTFDEPVFIGSAIAQLAGHADAVLLDDVGDWAGRLNRRFPNEPIELDAEIASLTSVMKARMTRLVLLVRPRTAAEARNQALLERLLEITGKHVECAVDLRGGAPKAVKGTLPV